MKGCIVRLLPENIHYELIQDLGIPPEALVLKVDAAMGPDEEVLIEFSQSHDILHDGGIEDGKCRRYWVDENLEILETPEDAPVPAPVPHNDYERNPRVQRYAFEDMEIRIAAERIKQVQLRQEEIDARRR